MAICQPYQATQDQHRPVGPLGCINRVTCGPKLFHSTSALLVVWSGLLWPSVWPTVHTTWLPVSKSIVNPPTLPLHCPHPTPLFVAFMIFQTVLNISQNQPVHPVAIQVSVMIAIFPTLDLCISAANLTWLLSSIRSL